MMLQASRESGMAVPLHQFLKRFEELEGIDIFFWIRKVRQENHNKTDVNRLFNRLFHWLFLLPLASLRFIESLACSNAASSKGSFRPQKAQKVKGWMNLDLKTSGSVWK